MMKILLIAPGAPPKNSPESIQVGRYLRGLAALHRVTLVTTPVERGWVKADEGLARSRNSYVTIELSLPFHDWAVRVLGSRYFASLRVPDKDFWIRYMSGTVLSKASDTPDLIYSRSVPFSSALLAKKIKEVTGRPWVMHLSDPWADSPYRSFSARGSALDQQLESNCVEAADIITLTTQSQRDYYVRKYPLLHNKFAVTPNILPEVDLAVSPAQVLGPDGKFRLVYAGALYGARRPTVLLAALGLIKKSHPYIDEMLSVVLAGNMTQEIRAEIQHSAYANVHVVGALSYESATALVQSADALVSIEPEGHNELLKTFFPSKLLDYIAAGKPILAITPAGSEAWNLCEAGYGLASRPLDAPKLAAHIVGLVERMRRGDRLIGKVDKVYADSFTPGSAIRSLDAIFASIVETSV